MELYLIRHGLSVANKLNIIQGQTEYPLAPEGIKQAEELAPRLAGIHFDRIYSSDLGRAMETARIIRPNAVITPLPGLREWDLGSWVGRNAAEIAAAEPENWQEIRQPNNPDFRPSGGESRRELRTRAGSELTKLASRHPAERILAVTHGAFLGAAYTELFGTLPPGSSGNTSITILRHDSNGWRLVCWNDTAHLQQPADTDQKL